MRLTFTKEGNDDQGAAALTACAEQLGFTLMPTDDEADVAAIKIAACVLLDDIVIARLTQMGLETLGDLMQRKACDVWRRCTNITVALHIKRHAIMLALCDALESRELSFADVAPGDLNLREKDSWVNAYGLGTRASNLLHHNGVIGTAILRQLTDQEIKDMRNCGVKNQNEILPLRARLLAE